mgnify:CR=1 FL=1
MIDHKKVLELVGTENIGGLSLHDKNHKYQVVKSYINYYKPFINSPLKTLNNDGCLRLGKIIGCDDVDKIIDFLGNKRVYNSHVKEYSTKSIDGIESSDFLSLPSKMKSIENGGIYCWSMKDLLENEQVLDICKSQLILNLVSSYLGCTQVIYSVNCMVNVNDGTINDHGVQKFHRDNDDFKALSCFIYLKDVDGYDGSHVYKVGSHVSDSCNDEVSLQGKKGHGFVTDSFGLHKGIPVKKGDYRMLLWIRYGMYDNHIYREVDRNNLLKIDKDKISSMVDLEDPLYKYVFGLVCNYE